MLLRLADVASLWMDILVCLVGLTLSKEKRLVAIKRYGSVGEIINDLLHL